MHLYHITSSANQSSSCNHEAKHMASIKIPTVSLFCKHTVLCIWHTKCGLVVKGHFSAVLYIFVTSKTNFRCMDVNILGSALVTLQHRYSR